MGECVTLKLERVIGGSYPDFKNCERKARLSETVDGVVGCAITSHDNRPLDLTAHFKLSDAMRRDVA